MNLLAIIALIPGLLIHSFIIVTNIKDWRKRSITPVDHIVTFLGISRMGMQCTKFLLVIDFERLIRSPNPYLILEINNAVYYILTYTNIWLTTLLLVVLCLKISNVHNRLFLCLKSVILPRTGHFIVASLLLAAFNESLPYLFIDTKMTSDGSHNTTMDHQVTDCIDISLIINFTLGSFSPLFFYFVSSILLFSSLYHHTVKMKMSSNLSINLETYYSAMRLVFFTFIYNTLYLIGYFVCAFYYFIQCEVPTWLDIILDFLPVLHSSFLIYRTVRLRRQMSKVLLSLIGVILQRKDSKMRENIEIIAH
ncbi:taste receptor type 2 member 125-like [Phyllobates terribilis]|uniref:taste receptor type 2 member 125-like n=1 Tax=Phyllobates terribilis TaxID=111132 RepID=UPI003CCB4D44